MWWLVLGAAFATPEDVVLDALTTELDRTMTAWKGDELGPYFLSYRVNDARSFTRTARYGALAIATDSADRTLDVSARVGSAQRDSTHAVKGGYVASRNFHVGSKLPLDGDVLALRTAVWDATGKEIRDQQEIWTQVKANQVVRVEDEDGSADFSVETPLVDLGERAALEIDLAAWDPVLTELSERVDAHPDVHTSVISLHGTAETHYFVSSEGTRIREARAWLRVSLQASTVVDDGTDVSLYRWLDVREPSALPDVATLQGWADDLRRDVVDMRSASPGEPYSGPVLLRGRAAGVFMHEVLGHRSEGHRQKDEDEGQTFKDKVGQPVAPSFLRVYDDPTLATYAGFALNGYYKYDQEGVPARRADLVDDGVYVGFLMSRSPVEGFPTSNGHGRAQTFRQPVARMANTIVETTQPKTDAELRASMVAELEKQGRPWGIAVDEIDGGFTMTGRMFPNAFNVRAVTAWRIYADGRADERVRGVDLVGTPLVALSNIVALGDAPAVFNGFCGAESGMVPNSAVSPSLLLRSLEVQKKEKGADRPPLLPKPSKGGDT